MGARGPQSGQPRVGGRAKGTPNVRTLDLMQTLHDMGYSPVAELIETARAAKKEYARVDKIHTAICEKRADMNMVPLANNEAAQYLKVMEKCAADMLPYMFPRRKSIEFDGKAGSALSSFAEIMLEAMKGEK